MRYTPPMQRLRAVDLISSSTLAWFDVRVLESVQDETPSLAYLLTDERVDGLYRLSN